MSLEPGKPDLAATQSGRDWRLAAVGVAAVLVVLVVATRAGGGPSQIPSPGPTAVAAAPTVTAPSPTLDPSTPSPGPTRARLPIDVDLPADDLMPGVRYVDGIPTQIEGSRVYRVRQAVRFPVGRTLMVGGWYLGRAWCDQGRGDCPPPTIADSELDDPRVGQHVTEWLVMDFVLNRSGPHVVWGRLETDPRCSIRRADGCRPRLHLLDVVWPI